MAIIADDLNKDNWPQAGVTSTDGKLVLWCFAKPVAGPLIHRIKDAWRVLMGEFEAIRFLGTKDIDVQQILRSK